MNHPLPWVGFRTLWKALSLRELVHLLPVEHFGHRDGDFTRAGVWLARVCGEHVVEHQNVARLPGKADGRSLICLCDSVYHLRLDWLAVAVIDVARIIFFVEDRHQRLPRRGFEKTDVM